MKVYTFGDAEKPAVLLLPGTCCHWESNFGQIIPGTEIHIFYALKMGEKYRARYLQHFARPRHPRAGSAARGAACALPGALGGACPGNYHQRRNCPMKDSEL